MDNAGYVMDSPTTNTNNSKEDSDERKQMSQQEKNQQKRGIYKNLIMISLSFLLLFLAFESMSKLQSSINVVDNLGTFSNSAVYASLILSCLFLPSFFITKLGTKWTMAACVLGYATYIAAQFHPQFYTLLPTAFVLGMCAAPLWSAKCTYLTQVAHRFALLDGVDAQPIVVKFFGIFFFFFQCNSIVGNIISTAVLSSGNTTVTNVSVDMSICGSSYCPVQVLGNSNSKNNSDNFARDETKIYTLATIYLCCSIASALAFAILVDPLTKYGENERREGKPKLSGIQLLIATFRHMKNPYQLLLIPLTLWSGIEHGFLGADFTAGFVTCAYGVHMVGRVLICYGFFDALSSILNSFLIQLMGRIPIFLLGAFLNVCCIIIMLSWSLSRDSLPVIFLLASCWGVCDGIWQTQINAMYGLLFVSDKEAAFSNYKLWESFGFFLGFLSQGLGVCILPKLYLALAFLILGMIGYLIVELLQRRAQTQHIK